MTTLAEHPSTPPAAATPSLAPNTSRSPRRRTLVRRAMLAALLLIPVPFVIAFAEFVSHHASPAGGGG